MTGAPWYIRNEDIRKDLRIDPVSKYIRDRALKLFGSMANIQNPSFEIFDYNPEDYLNTKYRHLKTILLD